MANTLTFEDRVVVVTGAGNGIGRAYAHEFAKRGAKVVVNDLGGSVAGKGSDTSCADTVVDEITASNGHAIANHDSVVDGEKIIDAALGEWGRIDVLLNNAGIAYPTPFHEMTPELWNRMLSVHVDGSYACTKAAWPYMLEQGFGRLLSPHHLSVCMPLRILRTTAQRRLRCWVCQKRLRWKGRSTIFTRMRLRHSQQVA